ncbi:MAG: zinc ribbon domain-containing protein [Sandaracinus sp.]|nr:zinc ribbon domain-containing protein [Sandaracinus sp.]
MAEGLQQQAQSAGEGYGTPTQSLKCQTCGATVSFAGTSISQTCDFCGSQHVLQQDSHRRVIRPQSLVPFGVDEAKAKESFKGWLAGLWFRPSDLKHKAAVGAVAGVYIPYWTFDARVHSEWRAEAGHYYYEQETYVQNGEKKTRQVRKTRWESAWGRRQDAHDDVLVVASQGLPRKIAQRFSTFDTSRLMPYDPRYLAGWRAEEYAVELGEAWTEAQQTIEQEQYARCGRDVPGDTHRGLQVQNQYSAETFKHVLLPLWIASYRYGDKPYRFLVNGQTGEVQGEAPISWVKVTLFVLMILLVIVGIVIALKAR